MSFIYNVIVSVIMSFERPYNAFVSSPQFVTPDSVNGYLNAYVEWFIYKSILELVADYVGLMPPE